jgi:predicted DNA-binding antitoxin AbrB/MazE fold protein
MSAVDAIYQNGVFKPLGEVGLAENQRVRLHVEPAEAGDWRTWLAEARQLQQRLAAGRGRFDSTEETARDRRR